MKVINMAFTKYALAMALFAVGGTYDPAAARITQYECKFPYEKARGGGWIPEILILTDDDVTGVITVNDPIIKHFIGTPIEGKLEARTKARSTYKWEVKIEAKGNYTRMAYTFSYRSNGQPANISARPGGYDNSFSADGTCKVSRG